MYYFQRILDILGIYSFPDFISTIILYSLIFGFIYSVIGLIFYLLRGFGYMGMFKKLNLKHCWLGFIPCADIFAKGKIAEQYIKQNGKRSANFSIWLILSFILYAVSTLVVIFVCFNFLVNYIFIGSITTFYFNQFVNTIVMLSFANNIFATIYCILNYVSLWRIFAIFKNNNATIFLVLCIFFNFLEPIFIFAIRDNEPQSVETQKFEYTYANATPNVCE